MNGYVDRSGRALIECEISPAEDAVYSKLTAWIDTGFNGDLVLPRELIERYLLPQSGTVKAILADGSQIAMKSYGCFIEWFGETR